MLSEGIKFSCDGVSYKTHKSQRVRKSVLKQPRQVSVLPTLGWLPPRAVDVDVFTHECLGEGCQAHMLQTTMGTRGKINSQIFSS